MKQLPTFGRMPEIFEDVERNHMTPYLLGYFTLRQGWAKLAEGTSINGQPIYSVTVLPKPKDARTRIFRFLSKAMDYIEEMS